MKTDTGKFNLNLVLYKVDWASQQYKYEWHQSGYDVMSRSIVSQTGVLSVSEKTKLTKVKRMAFAKVTRSDSRGKDDVHYDKRKKEDGKYKKNIRIAYKNNEKREKW